MVRDRVGRDMSTGVAIAFSTSATTIAIDRHEPDVLGHMSSGCHARSLLSAAIIYSVSLELRFRHRCHREVVKRTRGHQGYAAESVGNAAGVHSRLQRQPAGASPCNAGPTASDAGRGVQLNHSTGGLLPMCSQVSL